MPVYGTGIVPSGSIGTELGYVTRRAFVPKMVVQIWQSTPTLAMFLSNAQNASGGVSSVTVPVQGATFVTTQAAGYDGAFSAPVGTQGAWNAEFNLKLLITPIPFFGMESAVQVNAAIIPLIEARMNDAGNSQADYLSTKLWTNATDGLDIVGFPGAVTASGSYGGLSRSSYGWWQANYKASGGTGLPTRAAVLQGIVSATKFNGGEMPTFGVCGPGTWAALAQDFLAQEYYTVGPGEGFDKAAGGVRAAFTALVVGSVPIYMDPYATEGGFYFFNDRYAGFYIHEDAAWAWTGFASTLANYQLGYVGALVTICEFVLTKPKSATFWGGFSGLTL